MKPWAADALRAMATMLVSSTVAFSLNAVSAHPLAVWSEDGPGAWEHMVPRISVEELKDILKSRRSVVLLDVRSEDSFAKAHPTSAWNTPSDRFTEAYTRLGLRPVLREADLVVLLCENNECPAADHAARLLSHLGHEQVRVLYDGWRAYERSGLEVTSR